MSHEEFDSITALINEMYFIVDLNDQTLNNRN